MSCYNASYRYRLKRIRTYCGHVAEVTFAPTSAD